MTVQCASPYLSAKATAIVRCPHAAKWLVLRKRVALGAPPIWTPACGTHAGKLERKPLR